jgi:hypothetical protein
LLGAHAARVVRAGVLSEAEGVFIGSPSWVFDVRSRLCFGNGPCIVLVTNQGQQRLAVFPREMLQGLAPYGEDLSQLERGHFTA